MKITELLKKDTGTIILTAYVDKETGNLASIIDRTAREEKEKRLSELRESFSKMEDSDENKVEIEIQIEELKSEVESIIPFEFELSEPTFDVIKMALSAIYTEGGIIDTMQSGKVVFDACYKGNQGALEEIQAYPTLYSSLCSKCYHSVVEIADIEYKKK